MKGIVPVIGWGALGLALLVSFALDLGNAAQGGAIDLRNRITGARLLAAQIDPYHYKWHEPESELYCDPYNNPELPVSKTTATPALLLTHLPLAKIPYYRIEQLVWFLVQWALLLGTAWLWHRQCKTSQQRLLVAFFVVGFTYTAAWRLHAERGQSYVLLAFLFACWLKLTLEPQMGNRFWTGLIAGVLVALRPSFLLLVPFLALHRRGQLLGAGAGLLLGIVAPMFWDAHCWLDYFSAMQANSLIYRTDSNPHYALAYPPRIEGVPLHILGNRVAIPYADFSIHSLLKMVGLELDPSGNPLFPDWLPLLLAVVPFVVWIWFSQKKTVEELLPGLAAWLFIIDLFLPAYRNSYNDVLMINIAALGVVATKSFSWKLWPCFIGLPVGWAVYAMTLDQHWLINLPSFFFTLSAGLMLVSFSGQKVAGTAMQSRKSRRI